MLTPKARQFLNIDYPESRPFTKESVERTKLASTRFHSTARVANGWFFTDEEIEDRRAEVMTSLLP